MKKQLTIDTFIESFAAGLVLAGCCRLTLDDNGLTRIRIFLDQHHRLNADEYTKDQHLAIGRIRNIFVKNHNGSFNRLTALMLNKQPWLVEFCSFNQDIRICLSQSTAKALLCEMDWQTQALAQNCVDKFIGKI